MDKVRTGIIGLGNIGCVHLKNITEGKVPRMELTAVTDTNPALREWAAANGGSAVKVFDSAEELIGSRTCDAVIIAVPHHLHPSLAIRSFAAGLHVMCEKPAGIYTKEVKEMNAAAGRSGLVFGMMFNQRTNCLYREMHRLVQGGELGAVKRISWIITDWYRPQSYYDSGAWRATWAGEGGGVLLNQCPHQLDLLQWICGMPSKVRSFCHNGKWHDIEVEDDVTAYLEYPSGATGTFITSTADAPGTNRFELTMEKGKLVCENDELNLWELAVNERDFCRTAPGGFDRPPCVLKKPETDGLNEQHAGVLRAFTGRILDGTPLVADGREGIHGLTLSNAMHLSSWLDASVTLPFDEELFLEELNKRRQQSRFKPL